MAATPQITSKASLLHLPLHLSSQPIHITLTQLLPSTGILVHISANQSLARLSNALVVAMPRGQEVISSRLEGIGGVDEDIDRIARLLCLPLLLPALTFSKEVGENMLGFW
jgi:hypothetical protein